MIYFYNNVQAQHTEIMLRKLYKSYPQKTKLYKPRKEMGTLPSCGAPMDAVQLADGAVRASCEPVCLPSRLPTSTQFIGQGYSHHQKRELEQQRGHLCCAASGGWS